MVLGEPIAKGNTADIYLQNDKIIKLFNDFLPDMESAYEAYKQNYAYSCGLAVPLIYDVTKINGKQAIIMEYIAGRTVGDIIYEDMSKASQYMNLSVDVQIGIHKVKADKLELMTDKLNRQIKSATLLSDRQKESLTDKLQVMQYEKRLCHGDYNVFNIILKDNKATIIDWVDSSVGDIKADVYRTYLLYSQFSIDFANLYIKLYCQNSGLSREDIFIWEPIIAGARLSENVSTESAERLIDIVKRHCPV